MGEWTYVYKDQVNYPDQRFVHNIIMTPYLAQT